MYPIDYRKKCIIEGCNNLGEWDSVRNCKVYRRRLCSNHRLHLKKNISVGKTTYVRENFKEIKCGICEYCNWEGPCDCHRPNPGRYSRDNIRSTCPNCHRLITKGLIVDKFKKI